VASQSKIKPVKPRSYENESQQYRHPCPTIMRPVKQAIRLLGSVEKMRFMHRLEQHDDADVPIERQAFSLTNEVQ
jgi:hypothetical protein